MRNNIILSTDFDLNLSHTRVIRRNYVFLIDNLDSPAGLLDHLYASKVLDADEHDQVSSETESMKKNECLVSLISRKSAEDFERFLKALRDSSQGYIADRLTQGNKVS